MILLLASALAGVPDGVRGFAAPADVTAAFEEAKRPAPVCTELLAGHAALCFKVWEGGRRRWVVPADLEAWHTDVAALRLAVLERGRGRAKGAIERLHVAGGPADARSAYLQIRDGDGWAAGAVLSPAVLSDALGGGRFRVAMPRAGVLFAWADPEVSGLQPAAASELDLILMVAVREAWDAADDAVSPMVHAWNGKAFEPFGQARPKEDKEP